jgi:superkiller protein 3
MGVSVAGCAGIPASWVVAPREAKPAGPFPAVAAGERARLIAELYAHLRERPTDAVAYAHLGYLLDRQGRSHAARQAYERALALDPAQADTRLHYARLLAGRGNTRAALRQVQLSVRTDSTQAEAHALHGRLLRDEGRNQDAIAAFERAWTAQPPSVAAGIELADWDLANGRLDSAADRLRVCLIREPTNVVARRTLADVLARQRKFADAIEHWQLLVGQGEGGAEAYYRLADLYHVQGEPLRAQANLAAGRRIEPGHPDAARIAQLLAAGPSRPTPPPPYRPLLVARE